MPCFPYGRQVLFPATLSLCASAFLGYAIFDCNFVEIFNENVGGISVGFWQTADELNGNLDNHHKCVAWTDAQASTFDDSWNFGRYGGALAFALSLLANASLLMTLFTRLPPALETMLCFLHFLAGILASLLLLSLKSKMCTEFECWLDVGGVLCITASGLFLFCGCVTMSVGHPLADEGGDDKSVDPTEPDGEDLDNMV
ncbi:unknown protein [Seminavis robusta]|uniref:Uncharacterized protein n=1 Tax=Seminavis robusta TaxID=568900 RepID=A0A9N8HBH3_9STRA|nr:unknown protein [Seminavis robusta]|eukprot:Sro338_g120870.1 n/a (200) ;mRNA; r:44532-45131